MVEVSKHLFDQACSDTPCHTLRHPWNSNCWLATGHNYKHSLIGSAKFYAIIYAAQVALRGKKILKKEEYLKMAEYYARSTILGACISGSSVTLGCLLRWLLGNKLQYYSYLFLPNTLNGVFIWLEPPHRRGLVINLFCNLMIEFWLRSFERAGYINLTKTKQTFMFMVGSALLFYLMRLEGDKEKRTPLFWLFTAEKVRRKSEDSKSICPHDGDCHKHILKGASVYFGAGFAFTIARVILPKIRTPVKALMSIQPKHFKMALFWGSYIGIYRAVICYLCRKRGFDSALFALPAGCLSGLSFIFSPNLGFAISSLTAAFKLYSTILYEKKILTEKIPLPELLYCICQGTLFHSSFMHPDVTPAYVFKLIQSVSNHSSNVLYANMLEEIKRVAV